MKQYPFRATLLLFLFLIVLASPSWAGKSGEPKQYDLVMTQSKSAVKTGESVIFTVVLPVESDCYIHIDEGYGVVGDYPMTRVSGTKYRYIHTPKKTTAGTATAQAMFFSANAWGSSNRTSFVVSPNKAQILEIKTVPENWMPLRVGRVDELGVFGIFADGSGAPIHEGVLGTTYRIVSGDRNIVSISKDGAIKGLKPGTAQLKVTNGTHTAIVELLVNGPIDASK